MHDRGLPRRGTRIRLATREWHGSGRITCAPCVLPPSDTRAHHARHAPPAAASSVMPWAGRNLRNEKVRGSNPLSSTHRKPPLTRLATSAHLKSSLCHSLRSVRRSPPIRPGSLSRSKPVRSAEASKVVQVQVRRRDRRVPIHACMVTESTPRASHRHAAVWRRSWILSTS
jgi:hypothetical protein